MLLDDSEVIFDRQVGNAGEMEPDGSVPNRRREEEWLEATEPYHEARPRTTEFDRPADEGLGATSGGLREPHRNEGHQPLGPGDLPDQRKDTGGRNRPHNEWSPVTALEDTVSHMQRELNVLQTENRGHQCPCSWYDRRHLRRQRCPCLMDQPVGNSIYKCLMR